MSQVPNIFQGPVYKYRDPRYDDETVVRPSYMMRISIFIETGPVVHGNMLG